MSRSTPALVTIALVTTVLAGALEPASSGGQFWGDWFKKPHGGDICHDGDGTIVPCAPPTPPPPPDGGEPDADDQSRMRIPSDGDDSFCNLCHVNRTNEVAGPKMLRDSALADASRFWRRHGDIATRIVNKRVMTSLRDVRTLSPTLQRLMAARPRP